MQNTELIEVFQVLGIKETKDERRIKNAYREKLAVTNPEDNPEGFKRLRSAYEKACEYANRPEEQQEEAAQKDESLSGKWMEKAAAIYENLSDRQDVEKWRSLFEDDVFLSLEDEENCRFKLLCYMMNHYRVPTAVWRLLDEKLELVKNAAKLREHFATDFIRYIVNKCERGEDVEFSQFEGKQDAAYDLFLQYYDRCWQALREEKLTEAAEYIANADALEIFHPVMEICRTNLLIKQEKREEAIVHIKGLLARFPKDDMVCYNAAEVMWENGQKEAAAELYEGLKAENKKHYMANVRLSEWYFEKERFKEAKKCAEEVLSAGADEKFLKFLTQINEKIEEELEKEYTEDTEKNWEAGLELGWCYLQDGKISKGIRLTEGLKTNIPKDREIEREGLLTKLLVEEAEYEKAIALSRVWQTALEQRVIDKEEGEERDKDLDRIRQAHLIRMQCCRELGFADNEKFKLAIEEAEKIETGTSRDIGLLLEKAQIYSEMQEYEKSLDTVRILVENYQVYAAYATSLEVHSKQWNASGVVHDGRICMQYFPKFVRAYEHVAKVYLDLKYEKELKELLESADKNGIESPLLEAYRYQQNGHKALETDILNQKVKRFRTEYSFKVDNGDEDAYVKGLPLLTEMLYGFPGTYMLVERGIFHRAAHHYEEAIADFEKALAENPAHAYALSGLSFAYKYQGNYEKALVCIKRAILYMDEGMSPIIYADMGALYSLLGDYERAYLAYQQYEEVAGEKASKYRLVEKAQCLAQLGRPKEGAALLERLFNGEDKRFQLYQKLAELYQMAGCKEECEELLRKWVAEIGKKFPMSRFSFKRQKEDDAFLQQNKECSCYHAWQELLYGKKSTAVKLFERYVACAEKTDRSDGALADAVFAAILCGDDKMGKKFAAKLKNWLVKEKNTGQGSYYNSGKGYLQKVFLAAYYSSTEEQLADILAKEAEEEVCHFCTRCVCKEMEAVRILYLIRIGKEEEAKKRILDNLKKQPCDEYMLAIQHMRFLHGGENDNRN